MYLVIVSQYFVSGRTTLSGEGVITFFRTIFPAKVPVRSGRGLKKADNPDV